VTAGVAMSFRAGPLARGHPNSRPRGLLTARYDRRSVEASKDVNGRGRALDVSAASVQGAVKSGQPRPVPSARSGSLDRSPRPEQQQRLAKTQSTLRSRKATLSGGTAVAAAVSGTTGDPALGTSRSTWTVVGAEADSASRVSHARTRRAAGSSRPGSLFRPLCSMIPAEGIGRSKGEDR